MWHGPCIYELAVVQLPAKVSQHSRTNRLSGLKTEVLMVERGCLGDTCGGSEGRVGVNVIKIHTYFQYEILK